MNSLAIVVLANDEECVIQDSVISVLQAVTPRDKLFVIADNCTDDTAKVAENAGAHVVIRNNGKANGKGHALAWFAKKFASELLDYAMVVILDADSVIKSDFIEVIKSQLPDKNRAFQCLVYPVYNNNSPIARLAALSELIDQLIFDRIRTTLNCPVRFRGTGMVIPPNTLVELSSLLDTHVEDIALSLLLTAGGDRIVQIDRAVVYDPKPDTSYAASQQRARWFRGQWRALWEYREIITKIILKGPPSWSLLSSLFLRPKWLVLMLSFLLAFLFSPWPWLSLIFWTYALGGVILLLLGMLLIPDSRIFLPAIFHIPVYLWMWLQSIILSLQSSTWRRTRK
jgi:cellulose synthase/poly-beta-1,6-N-acetylglucosamine synthase-like glycosyltransferase